MSQDPRSPSSITRREVLKGAAALGAGAALSVIGAHTVHGEPAPNEQTSMAASMIDVPFEKRETVRVAIVGTGLRGRSVLHELTGISGVRITALCDPVAEKVEMAVQQMKKAIRRRARRAA